MRNTLKRISITLLHGTFMPNASAAETQAALNDPKSDISLDELADGATMYSAEVTEVLPDPLSEIFGTLRDLDGTVTAIRQVFGLLSMRHSIDANVLELRPSLNSVQYLYFQIGTTLPASTTGEPKDQWRSLGAFYKESRFENVELNDASWHERRYSLAEINAIYEARKR